MPALGLSCSMHNLVPRPGIKPGPPALGVQSQPLDHLGSPQRKDSKGNTLREGGREGVLFPFLHQGKSFPFICIYNYAAQGCQEQRESTERAEFPGRMVPQLEVPLRPWGTNALALLFTFTGCLHSQATGQSGDHLSHKPPPQSTFPHFPFLISTLFSPSETYRLPHGVTLETQKSFLFLSHWHLQIVTESVTRSWGNELKSRCLGPSPGWLTHNHWAVFKALQDSKV